MPISTGKKHVLGYWNFSDLKIHLENYTTQLYGIHAANNPCKYFSFYFSFIFNDLYIFNSEIKIYLKLFSFVWLFPVLEFTPWMPATARNPDLNLCVKYVPETNIFEPSSAIIQVAYEQEAGQVEETGFKSDIANWDERILHSTKTPMLSMHFISSPFVCMLFFNFILWSLGAHSVCFCVLWM